MESARDRDDTLEEVHAALRKSYHVQLTWLASLTGAAIVLSLLLVYLNRPGALVNPFFQAMVAFIDVGAIAAGLYFVVSIVDPKKYERAAKKVIDERSEPTIGTSPAAGFFEAFLHLERLVRDYLRAKDLYVPSRGAPKMSFSFRQMIDALRANEVIDGATYEDLQELNKYRNLVFHGRVSQVDARMVARTRELAKSIEALR